MNITESGVPIMCYLNSVQNEFKLLYTRGKRKVNHTQKKKQSVEIQPVIMQMLELVNQDFKTSFVSILNNIKIYTLVIPQQRTRNYKKNQVECLELKTTVSEII